MTVTNTCKACAVTTGGLSVWRGLISVREVPCHDIVQAVLGFVWPAVLTSTFPPVPALHSCNMCMMQEHTQQSKACPCPAPGGFTQAKKALSQPRLVRFASRLPLTLSFVLVSHRTSSCCTRRESCPATDSPKHGIRQLQPGYAMRLNFPKLCVGVIEGANTQVGADGCKLMGMPVWNRDRAHVAVLAHAAAASLCWSSS